MARSIGGSGLNSRPVLAAPRASGSRTAPSAPMATAPGSAAARLAGVHDGHEIAALRRHPAAQQIDLSFRRGRGRENKGAEFARPQREAHVIDHPALDRLEQGVFLAQAGGHRCWRTELARCPGLESDGSGRRNRRAPAAGRRDSTKTRPSQMSPARAPAAVDGKGVWTRGRRVAIRSWARMIVESAVPSCVILPRQARSLLKAC